MLKALRKGLVAGQSAVINTDYEGEIKGGGDTVRINSIGDITISSYSKDTDIANPQALTDAQQTMVIDQMKYFNFAVDDVDRVQAQPDVMSEAMSFAGYRLADTADQFILGLYTGFANVLGATGRGDATAITPTSSNVYETLVDASVWLDENNVPGDGRFVIVPPFLEGYLLKDVRFVSYGTAANRDALMNRGIGRAAGFEILKSNNVSNNAGADYRCVAGHKIGWTFADQISEMEAYRPPLRFSDAVKGLHVYGAKVVRPETLVAVHFNKS